MDMAKKKEKFNMIISRGKYNFKLEGGPYTKEKIAEIYEIVFKTLEEKLIIKKARNVRK